MALLDKQNLKRMSKTRNSVHEGVYATYTMFDHGNNRYFQIDTYGRSSRVMPEKASQTIQIDRETAEILIDLLRQTFNP